MEQIDNVIIEWYKNYKRNIIEKYYTVSEIECYQYSDDTVRFYCKMDGMDYKEEVCSLFIKDAYLIEKLKIKND